MTQSPKEFFLTHGSGDEYFELLDADNNTIEEGEVLQVARGDVVRISINADLSPNFHPVESRIRSSFGPIRSGVATAWGAKPLVERSAPGCCDTEALRAA